MAHPILSLKSCMALAGFTAFVWYLSTAFRGPWQTKYQIPEKERQKYLDIPEFAANFAPDSHPGHRKHREG